MVLVWIFGKTGTSLPVNSFLDPKALVNLGAPQKPVMHGVTWGPYKWLYKWETGGMTPVIGVITLLICFISILFCSPGSQ